MRKILISLLTAFFIGLFFLPLGQAQEKYQDNWLNSSNIKYKNIPENWWATFAIKEFDKVAPDPGSDWIQNMQHPGKVADWADQATARGWVVKRNFKEAAVGAIVITTDIPNNTATVGIIREVYDWGIVYESVDKDGYTYLYEVKYIDLVNNPYNYFNAYIWPIKQADYDNAPQDFEAKRFTNIRDNSYKDWRNSWSVTWSLKEFDKVAPPPGCNWKGNIMYWLDNAAKKGWKVSRDPKDAKVGALVIRFENNNSFWVQIVREVKTDSIVVENMGGKMKKIYHEEYKIKDLNQKAFIGYILPELQ